MAEVNGEVEGLLKLVDPDLDNLDGEFQHQSGLNARAILQGAASALTAQQLKLDVKRKRAEIAKRLRREGITDVKRLTEAALEMEVDLDPQVQVLENALAEANYQAELTHGLKNLFFARRHILEYFAERERVANMDLKNRHG